LHAFLWASFARSDSLVGALLRNSAALSLRWPVAGRSASSSKAAPACRRLWMSTRSNRGRVGGCYCTRRGTDSRHSILADDEGRLMSGNGHFEAKSDGYRCKSIGPIFLQELMFWGSASRRRVRLVHLFTPHLPFSPCVVQTCAWLAQRPGPADYIIKT
jgi:hypothetical protein